MARAWVLRSLVLGGALAFMPPLPARRLLAVRGATADELASLTVPMLKQRLRDAGLPVSGRKAELVDRLASGAAAPPAAAAAAPAAAPPAAAAAAAAATISGPAVVILACKS